MILKRLLIIQYTRCSYSNNMYFLSEQISEVCIYQYFINKINILSTFTNPKALNFTLLGIPTPKR